MRVEYKTNHRGTEVVLWGELDHHAARTALAEIHAWLDHTMPMYLTLNMARLSFMDSSGIALVLSLYKRMAALGGTLEITDLPPFARRILKAAGVEKLVSIPA
ncbi:MAG: STAS domain-containing protein [Clostridia bacterium]|nr:STAS domain-containing protein [Clostridia bacterium]